jgi:hypothetical protein
MLIGLVSRRNPTVSEATIHTADYGGSRLTLD